MTMLRLIFASILILMALYIVAMNWGCVIASVRNNRNGIDKHYSVVPLISLIMAYFAYLAYPHKPAFWIGLIPAVDIGNWHLLWLPVIFWRIFRERRKTKPSDLSSLHSSTDPGADVRKDNMITKWIALCIATVIGGLLWDIGSDFGLAFGLGGRPIALATIIALLWTTSPFRTRLVFVVAAIILSNVLATLIYALQTDPWYVTSDSETQLGIVISMVIQIGVSLVTLLAIDRIRRTSRR